MLAIPANGGAGAPSELARLLFARLRKLGGGSLPASMGALQEKRATRERRVDNRVASPLGGAWPGF